ncbi:acetylornithine deacetylase [Portibacter lacus]|uniref:Acetylornithine deacetylase n=1 Tax=Portibacter lacus TaxID=1099794 RepID=A0AA37SKZ2_9BACT|nr:acetylornithine deacetylase [Portibacter lacus]GLR15797.1 acetylornithine deacetylase [Portibacter lacus]
MNATQILEKLVSFPVLGGESNLTIIHWIKEYIESYGVECVMVPHSTEAKASLHCRIGPAVDGGIILSGHTDVVPVAGQDWDTDPWVLTDKGDGKLYARGSCDMKGFLACVLAVLPEMVKANLSKPIYFAFSYDEEIGCLAAPELVQAINDFYDEQPAYAIIGEPSLMQPMIGQKGIVIYETIVNGSAGHSSRIKQEVSAIHESARLVLWLEDKMNKLVEAGHIDDRFHPPHTSIHCGMLSGGIAPNVIADKARFTWDVRVIPKDVAADILYDFEIYCRESEDQLRSVFPGFKIDTIEIHPDVPPLDTEENADIVGFTQKVAENPTWDTVSYAAEAGQFAEGGYQAIICGPGSIEQAHRANEFIAKSELEKGVVMIQNIVKELSE